MVSKNARRISLFAALVIGRVPVRRRVVSLLARRSSRFAKAVLFGRLTRRFLATPAPRVVKARTRRAVIDVESR
ncbi:MAG: hypothetical protein FJW44_05055 [Actinobacteria bacterium]|nr:hypothetical protein [Actinomycetota bacterium]